MKKFILFILILCSFSAALNAVVACPEPVAINQPDGRSLTLVLHGDEFLSFYTTLDGYKVMLSEETGGWEYADKKSGILISSGILAHNAEDRNAQENKFLKNMAIGILPSPSTEQKELKQEATLLRSFIPKHKLGGPKFDYNKFRGLVILVEFSDRSFTRTDAHDLFDSMINKPDYTGFENTGGTTFENYTGSVHDYFSDNSGGKFKPQFDVFGPVKINLPCTTPNGTSNARTVITASLNAVDPIVDFSNYDTDGDGVVDMIYFIFAGAGSNYGGNNSKFIWPHASQTSGTRDGVKMGRYACSTELYGSVNNKIIDGIGTIIHEFSHVLGVTDFYDTDYEGGGGQSCDPGNWSVMASGSYNNQARTPVGYSAFERYANGFDIPQTISESGEYTLPYLGTSGKSYRLNSPINKEFFILENRQKSKWDSGLPGKGMLVFRVDSTNPVVWQYNRVNANPAHNYYELIRAMPEISASRVVVDGPGDPFPGSYRLKKITNFRTWNGTLMPYSVSKISEVTSNTGSLKDIRFVLGLNDEVLFEDFEGMPLTSKDSVNIEGRFTSWNLSSANVVKVTDTCGSGARAIGLKKNGELNCGPIGIPVKSLSVEISAPSHFESNKAELKVYLRVGDSEWTVLNTEDSLQSVAILKNSYSRVTYPIENIKNAELKFVCEGNSSEYCYLDNIYLTRGEEDSGVDSILLENNNLQISVKSIGGRIIINGANPGKEVKLYSIDGRLIDKSQVDLTGRATLVTSRRGLFIISTPGFSSKVII